VTDRGEIDAILDEGRKTRKHLPRGLWVVSIVAAAVCVIALAIALVQSWNVKAQPRDHSSRSIP
jgi:hypothetical protein